MTFDPEVALQEALQAHGLSTHPTNFGIVVEQSDCDCAFSAGIVRVNKHPTTIVVQLDVRAISERIRGKELIESFGGWAPSEFEAAEIAFKKFLRGSLHALLAALVDPKLGADQVEWERWGSGSQIWRVCLGPLCFTGSAPDKMSFDGLLTEFEAELVPTLSAGSHWVRVWLMKGASGSMKSELLVDNLDWPGGRRIVDAKAWPDGEYSARLFLMLMQP